MGGSPWGLFSNFCNVLSLSPTQFLLALRRPPIPLTAGGLPLFFCGPIDDLRLKLFIGIPSFCVCCFSLESYVSPQTKTRLKNDLFDSDGGLRCFDKTTPLSFVLQRSTAAGGMIWIVGLLPHPSVPWYLEETTPFLSFFLLYKNKEVRFPLLAGKVFFFLQNPPSLFR